MRWALICSGQGVQSRTMFEWFDRQNALSAKDLRRKALDERWLPEAAAAWLTNPAVDTDAVFRNQLSQPLVCLYQIMAWCELSRSLPPPTFFAGYSLGELSACACAGAVAHEDLIRLATTRAELMSTAPAGGMLAVTGMPLDQIKEILQNEGGHVAIVVAERHVIVGARLGIMPELQRRFAAVGTARATLLNVGMASHTPLMRVAQAPFEKALAGIDFKTPVAPVMAGVDAGTSTKPSLIKAKLVRQLAETIRWDECMAILEEDGCDVFLELGPGQAVSNMIYEKMPRAATRSLSEFKTVEGAVSWLAKALER